MSITRRTFLSICGLFCLVLLALNTATYLLFQYAITRQLITSQAAIAEANVQLGSVFTQTTDKLIYRYTSDTELGELLSRAVGRDELEDLSTKYLLNSRLTYHLNAENLLLNNGFRMELYLDPALPVSQLFTPGNTIPNVSRVFSGEAVAQEDWYQVVRANNGRLIFLNEDQTRLCFATKLQNSTYTGVHRKEGIGVLLGSLPLDRLPHLLSLFPITENSGFLLLNGQGQQVFCSEDLAGLPAADDLSVPDAASSACSFLLPLHLPELGAVGRQVAAAPKVVLLPGDQVPGQAAGGVEVGHILFLVGVDGHQHPLRVSLPLKDDLLIGEDHIAIAAVA